MAVATGVLAVNTYSLAPTVTVVAGLAYFVLLLIFAILTLRGRQARDHLQGEVMWGLLSHMNAEIFGGSSDTRFTYFGGLAAHAGPDRAVVPVPDRRH